MDSKHPALQPIGYPLPASSSNGDFHGGACVMGTPMMPQSHPVFYIPSSSASSAPSAPSAAAYNPSYDICAAASHGVPNNPYVHVYPVAGSSDKGTKETICKVLDRCGKKVEESTRKAGDLAWNVWHHLKTGPSLTDAAMARLGHGTKVFAEGGNDKMFLQNFGIYPGEHLRKAFACYISTSTGPVIGTLYLSSLRVAFCSDNPLRQHAPSGQQELVYYKVVVQLDQLRSINPSFNNRNPSEKYIQMVTSDNHEFWFLGFVSYDKALKNLRDALQFSHKK